MIYSIGLPVQYFLHDPWGVQLANRSATAVAGYEERYTFTGETAKLIQQLEDSPNVHKIVPVNSKKGNQTTPDNDKNLTIKQGSTIQYDPDNWNSSTNPLFNEVRDPKIGLVHEAGHAIDIDKGTAIEEKILIKGTKVPQAEINAIKHENTYREATGNNLRIYYGPYNIMQYVIDY